LSRAITSFGKITPAEFTDLFQFNSRDRLALRIALDLGLVPSWMDSVPVIQTVYGQSLYVQQLFYGGKCL